MPFQERAQSGRAATDSGVGAGASARGTAGGARPAPGQDAAGAADTVHTVVAGDTLWDIAQQYFGDGTQWVRIYAANRDRVANAHALRVGTALRIPTVAAAPVPEPEASAPEPEGVETAPVEAQPEEPQAAAPEPEAAQPEAAAPEPVAPAPDANTYTVRPGDTLSGISAKVLGNPGRWRELWELNRDQLPNPNVVRVGQVLNLPAGAAAPEAAAPEAPAPEPAAAAELGGAQAGPQPGADRDEATGVDGPLAHGDSPLERLLADIHNTKGKLLVSESARLGIEPGVAAAVMAIESGGTGFRNGQMVIRFEAHIFEQYGGQHVGVKHSGSQSDEYDAFERAKEVNADAAYNSISMGAPQIMGFNAQRIGYGSAQEMYEAFVASESAQYAGMFEFIRTSKVLLKAAQGKDWATFAKFYNGAGYAANAYDTKLAGAYAAYQKVTG